MSDAFPLLATSRSGEGTMRVSRGVGKRRDHSLSVGSKIMGVGLELVDEAGADGDRSLRDAGAGFRASACS